MKAPSGIAHLVLAFGLLTSVVSVVPAPAEAQDGGRKIALIIAIAEYGDPGPHPETGAPLRRYRNLNANNDIPLIRGALRVQGFDEEDIRVVRDAEADAAGMRDAFDWLRREADEGDVVVFHYSGHGHRLTNDNPDTDEETDGYDEVLVPHGAHDEFWEGYDGSGHIRDDEVGEFLADLRRRVGPTGNVTFFIDACHSGTATRGSSDELAARGSESPLGPPSGGSGDISDRGTGIEGDIAQASRAGTRGGSVDDDLAPYAVVSAASQRQVAYETYDVDGETRVGSLTYALARTLPEAGPGTTYRTLLAEITRTLAGKVRQTPQVEGTVDAQLFSDRLSPQRSHVVLDTIAGAVVALEGGSLLGLNPGTRLVVHETGTAQPDPANALATLEVVESEPLQALASVVDGTLGVDDIGAWAFITARTFGDLATRVYLDPGLRETDARGQRNRLGEMGIIEFVGVGADVIVRPDPTSGIVTAFTVADSVELARGAQDVVRAVEDFARSQYLRRLDFRSDDVRAELELAPVTLERDLLGRPTGCSEPDWATAQRSPKALGGGQWRMQPGDAYRLRVRNTGERRAFIAVLDLLPRGEIHVLRPRPEEAPESYEMEPGAAMELGCYLVEDQPGHETLKLFATAEPQDFRIMFETRGTRSGRAGDLSALEVVLARSYSATRSGEVGAPAGLASTHAVQLHVVRPDDRE